MLTERFARVENAIWKVAVAVDESGARMEHPTGALNHAHVGRGSIISLRLSKSSTRGAAFALEFQRRLAMNSSLKRLGKNILSS